MHLNSSAWLHTLKMCQMAFYYCNPSCQHFSRKEDSFPEGLQPLLCHSNPYKPDIQIGFACVRAGCVAKKISWTEDTCRTPNPNLFVVDRGPEGTCRTVQLFGGASLCKL